MYRSRFRCSVIVVFQIWILKICVDSCFVNVGWTLRPVEILIQHFANVFLSNFDGHWVTKPGKWPFKMVLCDWSFLLLMSHFAGALFNMLKLKTCKWSLLYDDSLLLCDGMHKCGLCCHAVSLSVCPSVCPSRSCILTKRINISSKSHRRITTPFYFFRAKHYGSILGHQMLNICLYHVLSTVWPPSVIHSFAGMWLWQVADTRSW